MINEINKLIEQYGPKSFGRLASCRPNLKLFLQHWNETRNCPTIGEQFFCIHYNIEPPNCFCGNKLLFKTYVKGYWPTCGTKECKAKSQAKKLSQFWKNNPEVKKTMSANQRNTCLERYGVENIMQNTEKLNEIRSKLQEKTGYASPLENPLIQEKCKKTTKEKYGVERPFQSKKIRNKAVESYIRTHGYAPNMQEARIAAEKNRKFRREEYETEVITNRIQTRRQLSSSYQRLVNEVRPYTYLIRFKPTGQVYYGVRAGNVSLGLTPMQDFMIHYQTSSDQILSRLEDHGLELFEYEIRRTFDTEEQAYYWEQTVLRRCKVVGDNRWFNQNACGYIIPTAEGRKKISEFHKGKPKSESQRKKMSKSHQGKIRTAEHCTNLSKSQKGRTYPDRQGEKSHNFGKIWISKKGKSAQIHKENLEEYLQQGWKKGRK